jgi:hypothetical protein
MGATETYRRTKEQPMMFTAHPDLMGELVNERIARLHAEADADRLARKFRAKRRPTLRLAVLR